VANPANEASLLAMALVATGAQLERLCRGYRTVAEGQKAPMPEERSVRRRLLPGGRVKLELVLEADEAELILRAVDRAREVRAEQAAPEGGDVSRLSHDPYFRRIKGCRSLPVAAVGGQRWQAAPSGWRSTWPDWSGIGEVEHPSEIVGTTDDQPLVVDLLQSPS